MDSRRVRISTLLLYLLFFAGGPGLHYAPVFGLHSHGDCAHANCPTENVCHAGCCSSHEQPTAVAGLQSDCDGSCALCDFYSQANPAGELQVADIGVQATAIENRVAVSRNPSRHPSSSSPRGPPRV